MGTMKARVRLRVDADAAGELRVASYRHCWASVPRVGTGMAKDFEGSQYPQHSQTNIPRVSAL